MHYSDAVLEDLSGWTDEGLQDELEDVLSALALLRERAGDAPFNAQEPLISGVDDDAIEARRLNRRKCQIEGALAHRASQAESLSLDPQYAAGMLLLLNYTRTYRSVPTDPARIAENIRAIASPELLQVALPDGLEAGCQILGPLLQAAMQQRVGGGVFYPLGAPSAVGMDEDFCN